MSRVDDIVTNETRSELIARAWHEDDADQAIAYRIFLARACTPDLEPGRGAITGRSYLEQVAPEELER